MASGASQFLTSAQLFGVETAAATEQQENRISEASIEVEKSSNNVDMSDVDGGIVGGNGLLTAEADSEAKSDLSQEEEEVYSSYSNDDDDGLTSDTSGDFTAEETESFQSEESCESEESDTERNCTGSAKSDENGSNDDGNSVVGSDKDHGVLGNGGGRYWSDPLAGKVCFTCGKQGHLRSECTVPLPCFLCGTLGHQPHQCHVGLCFNCYRPGHQRSDCPRRRQQRVYCDRCNLDGHGPGECPDIWCEYLWDKDGLKNLKPIERVYCYQCGEKGHFGDDCDQRGQLRGVSWYSMTAFKSDDALYSMGYRGISLPPDSRRSKHRMEHVRFSDDSDDEGRRRSKRQRSRSPSAIRRLVEDSSRKPDESSLRDRRRHEEHRSVQKNERYQPTRHNPPPWHNKPVQQQSYGQYRQGYPQQMQQTYVPNQQQIQYRPPMPVRFQVPQSLPFYSAPPVAPMSFNNNYNYNNNNNNHQNHNQQQRPRYHQENQQHKRQEPLKFRPKYQGGYKR